MMKDELMTYLLSQHRALRKRLRVLNESVREIERDLRRLEENKKSYSRSDYIRLKKKYKEQLSAAEDEQHKTKQQIEQCCARIREACGFSNA